MSRTPRRPLNLTRAEFLKGTLAFAATAPFVPARASAATPAAGAATVTEIAPGVFVHHGVHELASPENTGDICNTGFIVGTSGVAVVDTGGSLKAGTALRAAITQRTKLPVTHVINTHMHPDHVLGNAAFAADKPIFAGHHKLLRALSERTEAYLEAAKEQIGAAAFSGTEVVLPTLAVDTTATIDLGGRTLTLTARPTAHTNNDLTVQDSASGTLFLGDLVFVEHLPTLDGSLRGWLKLLEALTKEPAARAVPGHGPPSMDWPAAAADVARYLTTLAADVRKAIAAGQTMSAAMETAAQGEKDKWKLFAENNARNVSAAFAELEWE